MSQPSKVNAVYEALARFVVRYRWLVVVFWLVVAIGTGALPSIGSQINDNNSAFLSNSEPSIHAANLAAPILGTGDTGDISSMQLLAVSSSGPLNSADIAATERLVKLLKVLPKVASIQVASVSADGQAVQLRVRARVAVSATPDEDKVVVDALMAQFPQAEPPPGLKFEVAGQ